MKILHLILFLAAAVIVGCEEPPPPGDGSSWPTTDDTCPDNIPRSQCYLPTGWPMAGYAKAFMGSAVEGIRYSYHTFNHFDKSHASGLTDVNGFFPKNRGKLKFSIGDISLTETPVWTGIVEYPIISPMAFSEGLVTSISSDESSLPFVLVEPGWLTSLSTDQININRARFVQSVDEDGDISNGIKIANATHTAALGHSVDFSLPTTSFEANTAAFFGKDGINKTMIDEQKAFNDLEAGLVRLYEGKYVTFSGYMPIEYSYGFYVGPVGSQMGLGITTSQIVDKCLRSTTIINYKENYGLGGNSDEIKLCFMSGQMPTLTMRGISYDINNYGLNKVALFIAEVDDKKGGVWHVIIMTLADGSLAYQTIAQP